MTEKEQQPVTPEIPTEAADKPESDNPPKNENRRGANQAERERTIAQNRQRLREIVDVVRKHDILHGITPEKLCAIIEDLGPTHSLRGRGCAPGGCAGSAASGRPETAHHHQVYRKT